MPEQIEMYIVVNSTLTRSFGPFLDVITATEVASEMTQRSQSGKVYTPVPFFAAGNVAVMEGGTLEEAKAKAAGNNKGSYDGHPGQYL